MDFLKLDLNRTTPDLPTENEIRFQVALLAAVPALIASFIARFLFDAPLVPELLAQFILQQLSERFGKPTRGLAPDAIRAIQAHPWPGNVRELESAVQYALAIGTQDKLGIDDLPSEFSVRTRKTANELKRVRAGYENNGAPLAEIEKRHILSVLQQFDGNQVRAAAALGIDRSKLYRRLRQYGVKAVKFLQEEQGDGLQLFSSRKDEMESAASEVSAAAGATAPILGS